MDLFIRKHGETESLWGHCWRVFRLFASRFTGFATSNVLQSPVVALDSFSTCIYPNFFWTTLPYPLTFPSFVTSECTSMSCSVYAVFFSRLRVRLAIHWNLWQAPGLFVGPFLNLDMYSQSSEWWDLVHFTRWLYAAASAATGSTTGSTTATSAAATSAAATSAAATSAAGSWWEGLLGTNPTPTAAAWTPRSCCATSTGAGAARATWSSSGGGTATWTCSEKRPFANGLKMWKYVKMFFLCIVKFQNNGDESDQRFDSCHPHVSVHVLVAL